METDVEQGLTAAAEDQRRSVSTGYLMRQLVVAILSTASRKGEFIVCWLVWWACRKLKVRFTVQQVVFWV